MQRVTFKIEKQPPPVTNGSTENLELFHGIGNTLGFNITGGSDFSMPITIFHVSFISTSSQSSAVTYIPLLLLDSLTSFFCDDVVFSFFFCSFLISKMSSSEFFF